MFDCFKKSGKTKMSHKKSNCLTLFFIDINSNNPEGTPMTEKALASKKKVTHDGELITITDPYKQLQIVGLDLPYVEEYSFAWCPRADEQPTEDFIRDIEIPNEVFSPIHVCKNGDSFLVLAGRLRVKATRLIIAKQMALGVPPENRVTLRALIHTGDSQEFQRINNLENHKKPFTLLQQAKLYEFHLKRNGFDYAKCAQLLNVPEYRIHRIEKLLHCTSEIVDAFEKETLSTQLIDDFSKLERHTQSIAYKKIKAKDLSINQSKKLIHRILNQEDDLENIPLEKKIGKKVFNRVLAILKESEMVHNPYVAGALFMMEWQSGLKEIKDVENEEFRAILEQATSFNLMARLLEKFEKNPTISFRFKDLFDLTQEMYGGIEVSAGQLHHILKQMIADEMIQKAGVLYTYNQQKQ